ncbi:hypothetical protein KA005_50710 [bacterium]|nr:hypothetical protein [bacterium]
MKLPAEDIAIRREIIEEAAKIAAVYDKILSTIHAAPSEKKSLQGLKKLRQTMQVFERQNYYALGKLN